MVTNLVERRAEDESAVLIVCDFSPPRGSDPRLLGPVTKLHADFISVAYNPGKSIRTNSAFAAYWIKENAGKDVIFTLATRDMNRVAAQSLMLGAALLGLENVVIVRGDPFNKRDLSGVKDVNDFRPTELISSVRAMNDGLDYKGGKLRSPTSFCVGATIDLGHGIARESRLTHRKLEAGAQFFLLQATFEPQPVVDFLDSYADAYGQDISVPMFCGIQVMTADSLVFSNIPHWVNRDLEKGRSGEDIAVQVLGQYVDEGFKSIYLIPPVLRGGRRDYEAAQRVIESFKP